MATKKKIFNILLNVLIGLSTSGVVGIGGYLVYKKFFEQPFIYGSDFPASTYKDLGKPLYYFSSNNSFKVSLQNGDPVTKGTPTDNGTAWSLYLDTETDTSNFIWYVMTNFHVVADAIKYNNGNQPFEKNKPIKTCVRIKNDKFFALSRYTYSKDYDQSNYQQIISNNQNNREHGIVASDIDIITDYQWSSQSVGNGLELFSGSGYNIDAAIIRMKIPKWNFNFSSKGEPILKIGTAPLTFKKDEDPYYNSDTDQNIWSSPDLTNPNSSPNNFSIFSALEIWSRQYPDKKNGPTYNSNQNVYIAGNPGANKKLVASLVKKEEYVFKPLSFNQRKNDPNDPTGEFINNSYNIVDKGTTTPVYFEKWPLQSGSSGSAVYQNVEPINVDSKTGKVNGRLPILPIGLFWGGLTLEKQNIKHFSPCFIPFIFKPKTGNKIVNIYENIWSAIQMKSI